MAQLDASRSPTGSGSATALSRPTEVVLERWRVELSAMGSIPTDDFGPILPTVYKKAIVFFRSLFVTTHLLPAWKFTQQGMKGCHPALTPRCRFRTAEPSATSVDLLKTPIDGRPDPITEYLFGDLEVPVGRLSTSVTYRNDCNFRIDDAESLLSSRFMGVDENFFKPSIPSGQEAPPDAPPVATGSLQDRRSTSGFTEMPTYGSLSTFHHEGAPSTSPISALRAAKRPGSNTSSPPASLPPTNVFDAPHSMPATNRMPSGRLGSRGTDSTSRRPSISFQPFKAGSLSGSPIPRPAELEGTPSSSFKVPSSLQGLPPRQRTSLTAGMPASLRGGPPNAAVDSPIVGSPRPSSTSRYSSSFSHRRGRLSIGGGRPGEEENSSGRQSLASSVAQPGSGLLAEPPYGTSQESIPLEEDNISEFLKLLDSKKTLKSFEPSRGGDSVAHRTVAQLSRFHMMKESNNALGESMTSSMLMQRSSSASSRQLTSVPGMVPASVSPTPGKPTSPHTPHTPAIPSRLSENSIVDNTSDTGRTPSRGGRGTMSPVPEPSRQNTITPDGVAAIDIPLSPRLGAYQRRSSSVAQQARVALDDEEPELAFANRSISLGADDRHLPPLTSLLQRQPALEEESTVRDQAEGANQSTSASEERLPGRLRQSDSTEESAPPEGFLSTAHSSSPVPRRRYAGFASQAGAGRGRTPPHSSRGSFTGSTSRLIRADDESVGEEPLVFDLSEMDAQGRKSLEESRGAGSSSNAERSGFETRGTTRRGW